MFKFHYPFLKSKWSLVLDLAQWRPASLRWESCWNLLNDSERSAACSSIQAWQKTRGRDTASLQRGCPANGFWSHSVGLVLPISYIVNESLALVSPETKDALHLEWWNEIDISMEMEHPRSYDFPAKQASPLQQLSSERTHPPFSAWLLRSDTWKLPLTFLLLTLHQSPSLTDFTSKYTLSVSMAKVQLTFIFHPL